MVGHAGRKSAFVTHGSAQTAVMQDFLERLKGFSAIAHRFPKARCPDRDDHELLQIEVVVGMRTTVDDVHHRHRQCHGTRATEVAVQGQARFLGRRLSHRHGHRQSRVGTQARLVVGAVQIDQGLVDIGLLAGIQAHDGLGDFRVDVLHSPQHALAAVALGIAVAQLDRLA